MTQSDTTSDYDRARARVEKKHKSRSMREHQAAATTAGILYITGTVAGVLSKVVVIPPVRDAGDPFAAGAQHSGAECCAPAANGSPASRTGGITTTLLRTPATVPVMYRIPAVVAAAWCSRILRDLCFFSTRALARS